MRQTRKLKRKRRRRLRKGFKIFLVTAFAVIAIVLIVIFGFQLKTVKTSLDLGQFTTQEVKSYMEAKGIDNTLILWLKNKVGRSTKIELLEEYQVKLLSPFEVKINGYEKKLKGVIEKDGLYYYFDEYGTILKISQDKLEGIPNVIGLEFGQLNLYKKIKAMDKKALQSILDVTSGIEKYNYNVKKITINGDNEVSVYIKKLQIQLGKNTNLDRKLQAFNDMYSKVIEQSGILNMKHVSEDGSYTVKKSEEKTQQNK